MFAYWLLIFQHQAFAADPYSTALKRYNAHAHQPLVSLSRSNRLQLEKGDVVVSLDKSDRGWRASAMIVIQGSLEEIWIASRDQCQKQQKSTLEYVVNYYGGGSEDWYGLIDLPWPLEDRQWMIRTKPNLRLAKSTQNQIWERYWTLIDSGETIIAERASEGLLPIQSENAIYTPENRGAWFTVAIDSSTTILGYQVTTSIGGAIPDKVMMQFVSTTLDEMLIEMRKKAESIRNHYNKPHEVIIGGDGKPILYFKQH